MQLLIYSSPFNRVVPMLLEALRTLELCVESEHITSLEALGLRLRKPMGVPSMGILMPADSKELSALVKFRHLLRDMRIILVLPNSDAPTITAAHLLRPRYIGYDDGDLSDVIAVTSRMVNSLSDIPARMVGLAPGKSPKHSTMH